MFCMNPYKPKSWEHGGHHLLFPCRKCLICRIRTRNEWTSRMIFESFTSGKSFFITLTYAPQHLPEGGSLNKRDLQLFLKKLRFHLEPLKIRYFACGEYGEKTHRPHYHLIVWGIDETHETLVSDCWSKGIIDFKPALPSAFRYVAGYVVKKYSKFGDSKEFTLMSRRPGIGFKFLETLSKYSDSTGTDVIHEYIYRGKKCILGSYCIKRMRKMKFTQEYIDELNKILIEDYSHNLLTQSWDFLEGKYGDSPIEHSRRMAHARDYLKENIVELNRSSNMEFLKRPSNKKRRDKL